MSVDDTLSERMDERFDRVNERFDRVDERFDRVDERFQQIDQRFKQVDQGFDRVEDRVDQVSVDVRALGREMNQRFETLQRILLLSAATVIASLIGVIAALLAT